MEENTSQPTAQNENISGFSRPDVVVEDGVLIIGRGQDKVGLKKINKYLGGQKITVTFLDGSEETFDAHDYRVEATNFSLQDHFPLPSDYTED